MILVKRRDDQIEIEAIRLTAMVCAMRWIRACGSNKKT